MTIYFWVKENDLSKLDLLLKEPLSFLVSEPIHIFTEKVIPKSRLISISYTDYIFLEDNDLIKKIF
jgi:hypothetical protein